MGLDQTYDRFAQLDLEPILFSVLQREDGPRWSTDIGLEAADWYRKFLYLNYLYPGEGLVPTHAVDEIWHYHILDTIKYHSDCELLFGGYLHHFPYLGLRGGDDRDLLTTKFRKTLSLHVKHFGDDAATALRRISNDMSLGAIGSAVCAGACAGTVKKGMLLRPELIQGA